MLIYISTGRRHRWGQIYGEELLAFSLAHHQGAINLSRASILGNRPCFEIQRKTSRIKAKEETADTTEVTNITHQCCYSLEHPKMGVQHAEYK